MSRAADLMKKISKAEDQALYMTGLQFRKYLLQELASSDISPTGPMAKSFYVTKAVHSVVKIASEAPQAVIMEFGRRPLAKRPPMQSLVAWVKEKGIVSTGASTLGDMSSKDKGIIYVIAKSIGEKGIRPRRFLQVTWEKNKEELQNYYVNTLHSLLA